MRHTTETFPPDQLTDLLRVAQNVVHLYDIGVLAGPLVTPRNSEAINNLRSIVFTPDPPPKTGVTIDSSGNFV